MTLAESTFIAGSGVIASGGLWLLAQAEAIRDAVPEGASAVLAGMTGGGFCIWYAYYVTKVLLPQKDAEHAKAVKELSDAHQATIKQIVDQFAAMTKQDRDDRERDINRIVSIYKSEDQDRPADASRPENLR